MSTFLLSSKTIGVPSAKSIYNMRNNHMGMAAILEMWNISEILITIVIIIHRDLPITGNELSIITTDTPLVLSSVITYANEGTKNFDGTKNILLLSRALFVVHDS